jgi:CRISPR/Cas system-associated exonuclease Cas4 (RecB family)
MNVFSFSRLSLYETCPYRFYLKYVLGRPEPVTKPLALGKAVHKGIELFIQGASEEEAVLEALIECDFHPEVTRDEVVTLMHSAPEITGETEVHFELSLAPGSNLKLQGYIDLVCDGEFFDWKTNRRVYEPTDTMQLPLYAWAVMELKKRDLVKGTLYFLRYRRPMPHLFTLKEADVARGWAHGLAQEIAEKVSVVEVFPELADQLFPPQPGSHCAYCPFAVECLKAKSC